MPPGVGTLGLRPLTGLKGLEPVLLLPDVRRQALGRTPGLKRDSPGPSPSTENLILPPVDLAKSPQMSAAVVAGLAGARTQWHLLQTSPSPDGKEEERRR